MIEIINELGDKRRDFALGVLVLENVPSRSSERMATAREALEDELRRTYGQMPRSELKVMHPMDVYVSYYKKYGYTYHVLPQLESVLKGRPIPDGLPAVAAMFMAELKNMVLTAAHDMDAFSPPLRIGVSTGEETFKTMGGRVVTSVSGDFMLSDGEGVVGSILRGPDRRTAVTESTRRVLYAVYAPAGIGEETLYSHMSDIESYVGLASGRAAVSVRQIV